MTIDPKALSVTICPGCGKRLRKGAHECLDCEMMRGDGPLPTLGELLDKNRDRDFDCDDVSLGKFLRAALKALGVEVAKEERP